MAFSPSIDWSGYFFEKRDSSLDFHSVKYPAPISQRHSLEVVNGVLYILGGEEDHTVSDSARYGRVSSFDGTTWNEAPIPPRSRHVSTNYGNKLYLFGGLDRSQTYCDELIVIDCVTLTHTVYPSDTWPSAPSGRTNCAAARVQNLGLKILNIDVRK